MIRYINCRTNYGIETVSCIERKYFKTFKEFRKALYNELCNYLQSGHDAYISQRATKEWRNS